MRTRTSVPASFMLTSLVLALHACDSASDSTPEDTKQENKSYTAGVILPLTGPLAGPPVAFEQTALLARDEINEAGGVLGRTLKLSVKDSQGDPSKGKEITEGFVDENINVIFGGLFSSVTAKVLDVAVPNNILVLNAGSTAISLTKERDNKGLFYRTAPTVEAEGIGFAHLMYREGNRNVAIIVADSDYTKSMANVMKDTFLNTKCVEEDQCTVTEYTYDPEASNAEIDHLGTVEKIMEKKVDGIFLSAYQENGLAFVQAGSTADYSGTWYVNESLRRDGVIGLIDPTTREQIHGVNPVSYAGTPEHATFLENYMERYGEDPSVHRPEGQYDMLIVMALAAQVAKTTDVLGLSAAIAEVTSAPGEIVRPGEYKKALDLLKSGKAVNYEGASGPLNFDENGDISVSSVEVEFWAYRDGEFKVSEVFQP